MLVSSDDQVKAYIKKIMGQLDKWMVGGKISKLVVVITSKDTGEHVERWQFDVRFPHHSYILVNGMSLAVQLFVESEDDVLIIEIQVQIFNKSSSKKSSKKAADKENAVPEYVSSAPAKVTQEPN